MQYERVDLFEQGEDFWKDAQGTGGWLLMEEFPEIRVQQLEDKWGKGNVEQCGI